MEPSSACVTVTGEPGSGKTEMALQACAYVRERHRFDAIFFVDCKKASASANASANATSLPPASGGGGSCIEDPCRLVRHFFTINCCSLAFVCVCVCVCVCVYL